MRNQFTFLVALGFLFTTDIFAQTLELKQEKLETVGVSMSLDKLDGKSVVQVVKDSAIKADDEPTFARLKGSNFKDGTIKVNVLSRLRPDAPAHARGFIGVAFHINDNNSKFECIYIRPTNGRADDQIRRNHSIQYFSYPDYKFSRLRKESPEKYESHADMGLNEWIKMKIIVHGLEARLYLNNDQQPSLVIKDLKLGNVSGGIGLFVDIGTEGYFSDVIISKSN
jgi:hypothetical protein